MAKLWKDMNRAERRKRRARRVDRAKEKLLATRNDGIKGNGWGEEYKAGTLNKVQLQAREEVRAQEKKQREAAARKEIRQDNRQADATAQGASDMKLAATTDPSSLVTKSDVKKLNPNTAGAEMAADTGQLSGDAPQIDMPDTFGASKVNATTSAGQVAGEVNKLDATQGAVSDEATIDAESMDPEELAALDLEAEQLDQAQTVAVVPPRTVEPGEMISGSAVDMARVNEALDVQAAQADPTKQATVQGQLDELMTDFEGGNTPAWAAGALRNATAQMAARGLGASSMAGQALVQAAMESALPIAMQDASTFAKFESQNLSNRQQTAMFAAEQRANFLGMEFTQEFQARVANAAKVSDIANMNFTAEQTVALENARMAQTVDITNLNAKNAKMMGDAAAMSQLDMKNLDNRQQAAVMNAQSFLAMDMKNMDLEQQANIFKSQANINAILSDTAAINAAKQFNASSENQTKQFFANMSTQVQQFNAGMTVQRDQFNSQNALVVAQANAQWRQNVATINTAEQNEANRSAAKETNGITQSTLDQVWQRERDIMDFAFRQSESSTDRALSVFLADKEVDQRQWETAQKRDSDSKAAKGFIFTKLLGI